MLKNTRIELGYPQGRGAATKTFCFSSMGAAEAFDAQNGDDWMGEPIFTEISEETAKTRDWVNRSETSEPHYEDHTR